MVDAEFYGGPVDGQRRIVRSDRIPVVFATCPEFDMSKPADGASRVEVVWHKYVHVSEGLFDYVGTITEREADEISRTHSSDF